MEKINSITTRKEKGKKLIVLLNFDLYDYEYCIVIFQLYKEGRKGKGKGKGRFENSFGWLVIV